MNGILEREKNEREARESLEFEAEVSNIDNNKLYYHYTDNGSGR
jgi:hypothetical protein